MAPHQPATPRTARAGRATAGPRPENHVTVERDLIVRAPDGTALRTDVYRPEGVGPRPALLLRLPYGKHAADSDVAFAHPAWLAAQGFVVAVQDTRGRWSSDGDFYPFRDEAADGAATVEWTAGLPGCDGRVVSYGFSYPGLVQLLAAARRPRGLVGITPAFTAGQAADGWAYQGGALSGFTVEWAVELALDAARRAGDHDAFRSLRAQLASGDAWDLRPGVAGAVDRYSPWLSDWCALPADQWNVQADYQAIDVPALHVGGWWDRFARGTVGNFAAQRAQAATSRARDAQRLVMGPWRHMPWSPVPEPGPSGHDIVDLHLQWWRELLYGEPAADLRAPVRAWVPGEGWHSYDTWPPPQARTVPWYLASGGRAATRFGDGVLTRASPGSGRPPLDAEDGGAHPHDARSYHVPHKHPYDVLPYDPWLAVARPGGHGCCLADVTPMGPACQCAVEESPTIAVYTSPPLPAPLLIVGDVAAEIWLATDAFSADLGVRLCVVSPSGCSQNLQEGIVRTSAASASPPSAPAAWCHRVDLGPVARRLQPGERIRLQVSGSDHPLFDVNLGTGEPWSPRRASFGTTATQFIWHDAAHPAALLLPVIPAGNDSRQQER